MGATEAHKIAKACCADALILTTLLLGLGHSALPRPGVTFTSQQHHEHYHI
jgi:hypothetical protein